MIQYLLDEGVDVSYSDPHVPSLRLGTAELVSKKFTSGIVKKQKAVVILTDHSAFDMRLVVKNARLILDTRNALRRFHPMKHLYFL